MKKFMIKWTVATSILMTLLLLPGPGLVAQEIESITQTGHSFFFPQNLMIYDLQFTKDSRHLLSAGQDGQVIVWDVASGRKVKSFFNQVDNQEVSGMDLSKDEKKIVLGSPFSQILQMDYETGEILDRHEDKTNFSNLPSYPGAVYMDDGYVVSAPWGLSAYKPGQMLPAKEKPWGGANNGTISLERSPDRTMLAITTSWKDQRFKLFSYPKFKKIKSIKLEDITLTPAAISKTNRYVAVEDGTGKFVWVLDKEKKYKVVYKVPMWRGTNKWDTFHIDGLAFSPDEKNLFVGMTFSPRSGKNGRKNFVQRIDLLTGKVYAALDYKSFGGNQRINRIAMSPDGKVLAVSMQNPKTPIQTFEYPSMKKIRDFNVYSLKNNAIAVSGSGRYLVSAQGSNMVLWDLHKARPAPIYFAKDSYQDFCFSKDEKIIYAITDGGIYKYYLDGRKGIKSKLNWGNHIHLSPQEDKATVVASSSILAFETAKMTSKTVGYIKNRVIGFSTENQQAMSPNGKWEVLHAKGTTVMDLTTGKTVMHKEFPKALSMWVDATAINAAGTQFVIGNLVCEIPSGKIIKVLSDFNKRSVKGLAYSPDGKLLALGTNTGDLAMINTDTWEVISKESIQNIAIRKICFDTARKRLFAGGFTGEISVFDYDKKQLVASFNGISPEQYIMRTAAGYYHSSKGTLDIIHYRKGPKVFGFENFDLIFNRPDIVAKALLSEDEDLIESYQKAWLKRVEKMGLAPEKFQQKMILPEVRITNDIPLTTKEKTVTLNLEATDSEYSLDRINIYVNGVPLKGRKGFAIAGNKKSIQQNFPIELTPGTNKITASVLNSNGTESLREEVNLTCTADFGKADFYYLGVGISKFVQSDKNLTYADKDARDLATFFQNKNESFRNQYVKTVTNQEATTSNIVAQIKDFVKNARPQDVVIITFSSHGGLDKNFDYFLATHDMDFKNMTETGLAYNILDELMDGVKARQKLLMIDACHSGEIDKTGDIDVTDNDLLATNDLALDVKTKNFAKPSGEQKKLGLQNSFYHMKNLFADLRRGSGTEVISAAAGVEYALESSGWANGIFTYSVLDGLTKNKADTNKDKRVSVSELQKHVYQTVVKMTGGKQHPVNRAQNLDSDFTIW